MRIPLLLLCSLAVLHRSNAIVVFETTSPYHHIRVVDEGDLRTMCFDDALETRISIQDPLKQHFEYTQYFHMPWLWNTNLANVLIIGLGGGSTQMSFEHYYPGLKIETVEIDPVVLNVAKEYFQFKESENQKVQIEDGRVFLRRNQARRDLLIVDAYVQGRYGSSIPQHLATKEFFELARDRLSTNGVVAYNVIGTTGGWRADIVGAIYRTMKSVFPQVYLFPAKSSLNVVLIGTRATIRAEPWMLRQRAQFLVGAQRLRLPGFLERLESLRLEPPLQAARSPVLTDDFAPVEGLSAGGGPATRRGAE